MAVSTALAEKISDLDPKLRAVFECLIEEVEEKTRTITVGFSDFKDLKEAVREMVQALKETQVEVDQLTQAQGRTEVRMEELALAQGRTEVRMGELAQAQRETQAEMKELAQAQGRTEVRMGELAQAQRETQAEMKELALAQGRTEVRMGELAQAQRETQVELKELGRQQDERHESLLDKIAALGGRWGIYNEVTFRSTVRALMSKTEGVEVREGFYGNRQVDVIIRNGEHVMLEITSRMHEKDIEKLYRSADDYKAKEGIEPLLMVATGYVSPRLMQKILGLERKIDIFSYESND